MATIKSYTDIKQSKKLAKFLPLESADMHYFDYGNCAKSYIGFDVNETKPEINKGVYEYIPCWSLASLLGVLPNPSLHKTYTGWRCDTYNENCTKCQLGDTADNPVDACVATIKKLHEQKML